MVDLPVAEDNGVIGEAGLGRPSEVEDDLEKLVAVFPVYEFFRDPRREFFDDLLEVCFNPLLHLACDYTSEFAGCWIWSPPSG